MLRILQAAAVAVPFRVRYGLLDGVLSSLSSNINSAESSARESPATDSDNWNISES